MKIKKKHIFRFFGPFFSSFIIFGWDFVENEKNHQKSTVILLHFWLSKQKNYFWSHAKLAKMSSFQCTVGGGTVFRYPKVATIPKWVAALWKNVEWPDGKNTNLEFMTLALQRDMRDMWLQEVCCFPMARYLWFSTTKQIDKMHLIKICAMKGWLKVSWASDPPMM